MIGSFVTSFVNVANAATDTAAAFGRVLSPIVDNILLPIIYIIFAVAVFIFAYGVLKMVMNPTDSEAHTQGRWSILGGVVGMFIMLSAWGIIYFISGSVKDIVGR